MTSLNPLGASVGISGDVATKLDYQFENKPYTIKNIRELILKNASARSTMTVSPARSTLAESISSQLTQDYSNTAGSEYDSFSEEERRSRSLKS